MWPSHKLLQIYKGISTMNLVTSMLRRAGTTNGSIPSCGLNVQGGPLKIEHIGHPYCKNVR